MVADGQTALNPLQLLKLCNKAKHILSPSPTDDISSTHHMKTWHKSGSSLVQHYDAEKQMMGYVPERRKSQYYSNALHSSETDVASCHAAAQWNEVNQFWPVLTLTDLVGWYRPVCMTQTNFSLFMKDYNE